MYDFKVYWKSATGEAVVSHFAKDGFRNNDKWESFSCN